MSARDEDSNDDDQQPQRTIPRRQSMSKRQSMAFELPMGGDYYEITIDAPSLGILFYDTREVDGVLLSPADREITWELRNRPVVTFCFEGSAGYQAGIDKGHILCKVNEEDVTDKQNALQMLRQAKRPMKLFLYCPPWSYVHNAEENLFVHVGKEGDEMKWPKSLKEWRKQYAVVGGILASNAGPMLKFYKNKSEYSTAVLESVNQRKLSVDVEEHSLEGAYLIQNDDGEEDQVVRYDGCVLPLTFIVVVIPAKKKLMGLVSSSSKTVIKLASFQPMRLRSVWEGLRRCIEEQQQKDDGPYGQEVEEERGAGIPEFIGRRDSI